jgi:hypothetical protein
LSQEEEVEVGGSIAHGVLLDDLRSDLISPVTLFSGSS